MHAAVVVLRNRNLRRKRKSRRKKKKRRPKIKKVKKGRMGRKMARKMGKIKIKIRKKTVEKTRQPKKAKNKASSRYVSRHKKPSHIISTSNQMFITQLSYNITTSLCRSVLVNIIYFQVIYNYVIFVFNFCDLLAPLQICLLA